MNTRAAINETMKRAAVACESYIGNLKYYQHPSLGMQHLVDMHSRIDDTFSDDKLNRWLGWMQAAIVVWDCGLSVEDMKDINKRHS